MKNYLLLAALVFSATAWAETEWEMEQLARACDTEKFSLLRERNGTPSCKKLAKLQKQQKKKNTPSKKQKAERPQQTVSGGNYHWNAEKGRYCYHNEKDRPTACY